MQSFLLKRNPATSSAEVIYSQWTQNVKNMENFLYG